MIGQRTSEKKYTLVAHIFGTLMPLMCYFLFLVFHSRTVWHRDPLTLSPLTPTDSGPVPWLPVSDIHLWLGSSIFALNFYYNYVHDLWCSCSDSEFFTLTVALRNLACWCLTWTVALIRNLTTRARHPMCLASTLPSISLTLAMADSDSHPISLRAEKSEVLTEDLAASERRVENLRVSCGVIRKRLTESLSGHGADDDAKRLVSHGRRLLTLR